MKVAIVHDWLTNMGGSEKVVLALHEMFPDAPIFTSVYNPDGVAEDFRHMNIVPSFIQKLPFAKTAYQVYLPLMPLAFENFDLRSYDLIISSSHSCAKGILAPAEAVHVCYCHTPMRYAWSGFHEYLRGRGRIKRTGYSFLLHYLRIWDRSSADRVDYFIANSSAVSGRIRKYYRRASVVIHPPVDVVVEDTGTCYDEGYYLIVSRLVPYKRVDLAVEACKRLNKQLVVVGDGPERSRLERISGSTTKFIGRASDREVANYYSRCKALIFPGEEDFGITPVEAQYFGKPVIAYGAGGVLDTVIDGVTGVFFSERSAHALMDAVKRFEEREFDSDTIRTNAQRFCRAEFDRKFMDFVARRIERR